MSKVNKYELLKQAINVKRWEKEQQKCDWLLKCLLLTIFLINAPQWERLAIQLDDEFKKLWCAVHLHLRW